MACFSNVFCQNVRLVRAFTCVGILPNQYIYFIPHANLQYTLRPRRSGDSRMQSETHCCDEYHYNHADSPFYAAVTPTSDVLYRVVFDTSGIFSHCQLKASSYQVLIHCLKDDKIEISPRGDLPHRIVQETKVEQDEAGSCTNGFIFWKLRQIKNSSLFLMWLEMLKNDHQRSLAKSVFKYS